MSTDPPTDPPEAMHWRERYEYEARREAERLVPLDERALVERVRSGRLDDYFAIWRALGKKGTVAGSALVLWTFLRDHPGESWMHHRYHCADALFRILGMNDPASQSRLRRRVQWDHEGEEARQHALAWLREAIDGRTRGRRGASEEGQAPG